MPQRRQTLGLKSFSPEGEGFYQKWDNKSTRLRNFASASTINSAYGQLVRMMRLMLEGISNGFEYFSIEVKIPETGEYADSTEEGKLLFEEVCKLEYKGSPTHDIHETLKKAFASINEMLVVHVPKDQIIDISTIQVEAGKGFDVGHAYGELIEAIYVILNHISLALKSTNIRFSKIHDGGSHDYYLTSIDAQYVAEEATRVLLMCVEQNQSVSDSDKTKAYEINEDVHDSIMASLEEVHRVLDSSPPRDFEHNLAYVTGREYEFEQE